jgi:hypothetical protein
MNNSKRDMEPPETPQNGPEDLAPAATPYRVRLPGFLTDRDLGLGDAIQRVTYAFGVRSCGGCQQRRESLNNWMVFGGKRP